MLNLRTVAFVLLGILCVGLFAASPLTAGSKKTYYSEPSFIPIPQETVSIINGVKIKFTRDERGCIQTCEYQINPELCGKNGECCQSEDLSNEAKKDCLESLKNAKKMTGKYKMCERTESPKIDGETVVYADNTIDNPRPCNEFRIVTHGSPGWKTSCSGGNCTKVCLGYYFPPWCCQIVSGSWQCSKR